MRSVHFLVSILIITLAFQMVGISRAMIFWHPDIEAKIIGPSTTNLVAGAKYPLVVSIINKDTWFSEDGKDPKIFVDVTGAVIVKAESAYFTSISPSNIPAEGVSHVEFSLSGTIKKNTLLSAVIIIKVQPGTVTIKVKCQAGDFDGWPDSPTQESESTLTYQVTSLMPGPLMFADLADYRSQCAIDYANLYKDFILYGKPFQTTSRDKLTQDMVNSAKQAGELLEWTEIALNWIMDPAAGLFSAFAKMIGDVTGMPSLMSILDFATLLLERADRELTLQILFQAFRTKELWRTITIYLFKRKRHGNLGTLIRYMTFFGKKNLSLTKRYLMLFLISALLNIRIPRMSNNCSSHSKYILSKKLRLLSISKQLFRNLDQSSWTLYLS
jgi:hypothetical protein